MVAPKWDPVAPLHACGAGGLASGSSTEVRLKTAFRRGKRIDGLLHVWLRVIDITAIEDRVVTAKFREPLCRVGQVHRPCVKLLVRRPQLPHERAIHAVVRVAVQAVRALRHS